MKRLMNSLRNIFYFIQNYFIKAGSPIGVYYQNLSQECYKFFEKDMKKSAIFLKSNDKGNILSPEHLAIVTKRAIFF